MVLHPDQVQGLNHGIFGLSKAMWRQDAFFCSIWCTAFHHIDTRESGMWCPDYPRAESNVCAYPPQAFIRSGFWLLMSANEAADLRTKFLCILGNLENSILVKKTWKIKEKVKSPGELFGHVLTYFIWSEHVRHISLITYRRDCTFYISLQEKYLNTWGRLVKCSYNCREEKMRRW